MGRRTHKTFAPGQLNKSVNSGTPLRNNHIFAVICPKTPFNRGDFEQTNYASS